MKRKEIGIEREITASDMPLPQQLRYKYYHKKLRNCC